MAIEAAMIPVPGSAVAQMVAFTDSAVSVLALLSNDQIATNDLRLNPFIVLKLRPSRYTILKIELTLPTAPRPMTILTLILLLRSSSLSTRTLIGINTNVQSAITLMMP